MTNLHFIKTKIPNEDRKVSVNDPSKSLKEFFYGVLIQFDTEYIYES